MCFISVAFRSSFIIPVPLHEVGATHKCAVFCRPSIIVPQIEIDKFYRFIKGFIRKQPLLAKFSHQRFRFGYLRVGRLDNPFCLSINSLHMRFARGISGRSLSSRSVPDDRSAASSRPGRIASTIAALSCRASPSSLQDRSGGRSNMSAQTCRRWIRCFGSASRFISRFCAL